MQMKADQARATYFEANADALTFCGRVGSVFPQHGAVLSAYLRRYEVNTAKEDEMKSEEMIKDFEEKFPERCPICSYHEFGLREGHVKPGTEVQPHVCKEAKDGKDSK